MSRLHRHTEGLLAIETIVTNVLLTDTEKLTAIFVHTIMQNVSGNLKIIEPYNKYNKTKFVSDSFIKDLVP